MRTRFLRASRWPPSSTTEPHRDRVGILHSIGRTWWLGGCCCLPAFPLIAALTLSPFGGSRACESSRSRASLVLPRPLQAEAVRSNAPSCAPRALQRGAMCHRGCAAGAYRIVGRLQSSRVADGGRSGSPSVSAPKRASFSQTLAGMPCCNVDGVSNCWMR